MSEDLQRTIDLLETLLLKIKPLPWEWNGNIPFYIDVSKPRPSLSKHDYDNKRPTYWHHDDGMYASVAIHAIPQLLAEIKRLNKELKK